LNLERHGGAGEPLAVALKRQADRASQIAAFVVHHHHSVGAFSRRSEGGLPEVDVESQRLEALADPVGEVRLQFEFFEIPPMVAGLHARVIAGEEVKMQNAGEIAVSAPELRESGEVVSIEFKPLLRCGILSELFLVDLLG